MFLRKFRDACELAPEASLDAARRLVMAGDLDGAFSLLRGRPVVVSSAPGRKLMPTRLERLKCSRLAVDGGRVDRADQHTLQAMDAEETALETAASEAAARDEARAALALVRGRRAA